MEKVKGQRASKTWVVTGADGVEVKVTKVNSAEEAMAQVPGAVEARPLRKFKIIQPKTDAIIEAETVVARGAEAIIPACEDENS